MLGQVLDGKTVRGDPALTEYLRWRYGEPLVLTPATMPAFVWHGFSHLCRAWGKEGRPTKVQPATESVQKAVADLQVKMNAFAPGSQSAPVMHGLTE